jgi:hypothetical protein
VIEGTSQRKPPYPQYTFAWGRVSDDVASVNVLRDPGAPSDVRIVAPPPGFEVLGRLVAIHYAREQPARVDALAPNGDVVSEVSIG